LNPLVPLYRVADRLRYRKHRNLGQHGEDLAHRHVRRLGFTVVARNYRPPQGGGEIDLVAWDGPVLVFVEVKARTSGEFSAPERAIDPDKIRALRRTALDYVRRSGVGEPEVRFDVIAIADGALEHFRNVFALGSSPKAVSV
jgi:putative endonuclease